MTYLYDYTNSTSYTLSKPIFQCQAIIMLTMLTNHNIFDV